MIEDDAGCDLDLGSILAPLQWTDPVEVPVCVQDDRPSDGLATLGGSRAPWQHGDAAAAGDGQHRLDVFGRLREDDAEWLDLVVRRVRRVEAAGEPIEEHLSFEGPSEFPLQSGITR